MRSPRALRASKGGPRPDALPLGSLAAPALGSNADRLDEDALPADPRRDDAPGAAGGPAPGTSPAVAADGSSPVPPASRPESTAEGPAADAPPPMPVPAPIAPPGSRTPVEDTVLAALDPSAGGGASTREIARRISRGREGLLHAREGHLLPLLFDLRRRGRLDAAWEDLPEGRRFVHRRTLSARAERPTGGGEGTTSAGALPAAGRPAGSAFRGPFRLGEAARHVAVHSASTLEFAPRLAEEVRAQALHHLEDAAADHVAAGCSPQEAERRAIADWGDPWRIATDLRRAVRGRPSLPFPRGALQGIRAILVNDAPILGAILGAIAFLRIAVIGAYHIPTKSMEPTLHGDRRSGDRILVLKGWTPPDRFDIWVFDGWGAERKHFVKRVVGLPGEEVRLLEGDLWVDGRLVRKEGANYEALLFPLFDLAAEERRAARKGAEELRDRIDDAWDADGGSGWTLHDDGTFEGRVVRAAPEEATLSWGDRLTDAVHDVETLEEIEPGFKDVCDLRVEADVTPEDATARIAIRLERGPLVATAVLRGEEPGVAFFVDGREVLRRLDVAIPPGRTTRVRFAQVDHVLRLEVDGELVLRLNLPEPERPRRDAPPGAVEFRIDAGAARIRPLRLERDVHWTSEFEAIGRPALGDDEYFMLGDNSSNSEDSRRKGPVHGGRLVGRPILVVWPFSRLRVPR